MSCLTMPRCIGRKPLSLQRHLHLTHRFSLHTLLPQAEITPLRRQRMLPAYRTEGEAFAIPKFELTPQDVDGFLDELRAFHHHFRACFARSEPREHFFNYMVGQCSVLERKSIEPMALHVEGGNIRGMQRC